MAFENARFVVALEILCASLLSSCIRPSSGEGSSFHTPGHDAKEAAETHARSLHWEPFCDAGGADHCGLVAYEVFDSGYVNEFAEAECVDLPEPILANCAARLQRHFMFRVMQRYARAEAGAVPGICEKIPVRCSHPVVFELLALEAHNYSLESFPHANFSVTSAHDANQQKQRVKAIVGAVVSDVYERLKECEDGTRDCSCPEGLLAGQVCQSDPEPEKPDQSEVQWL